jgi:hypothetical protein
MILPDRDLGLDRIQKANELLMAVPLHAAADHLVFEHIESANSVVVACRLWSCVSRPGPSSSAVRAEWGRAPGFEPAYPMRL